MAHPLSRWEWLVDRPVAERALLIAQQPLIDAARVKIVVARKPLDLLPTHEADKADRTVPSILRA